MKRLLATLIIEFTALLPGAALAQSPNGWHDDLVDHMVGTWKVAGNVKGTAAHHTVTAEWVLNHQFLRMYEKTSPDAPSAEHRYEAIWFLGYDDVKDTLSI